MRHTFDVEITHEDRGGRNTEKYRIYVEGGLSQNDALGAQAAEKALKTFREHGHDDAPYNDHALTVSVRPVPEGGADVG